MKVRSWFLQWLSESWLRLCVLIHKFSLWLVWVLLLHRMFIGKLFFHHLTQGCDFICDSPDSVVVVVSWELLAVHRLVLLNHLIQELQASDRFERRVLMELVDCDVLGGRHHLLIRSWFSRLLHLCLSDGLICLLVNNIMWLVLVLLGFEWSHRPA